jgi:hypothetical protein
MKKTFLLSLIITALFFVPGCRKNDVAAPASQKDYDAAVALDWYKLQLRILLERNSALNGTYFGYIGIGLYESVRNGTDNSISLSTKLYQMSDMPAKEATSDYHWGASANAALAAMLRSFYGGLTAANNVSIDSLENAYNTKFTAGAGTGFARSQ